MQDDIIQVLTDWVAQHPRPREALLPQNMGQNILDILIADTQDMIKEAETTRPQAQRYITAATLLLKAQIENTQSLDIRETELTKAVSRLTHGVHLENMRRKGLIKELQPEFSLDNIFDPATRYHFQLTELGQRATQDSINPLPTYH